MKRIFILARTPALRTGLRAIVTDADLIVAGEAATLESDGASADGSPFDVYVVGDRHQLPELAAVLDGAAREAAVVLSNDAAAVDALRALPLRGWGVVPSDATPEELRAAVRAAALGLVNLTPALVRDLSEHWRERSGERSASEELAQPLTAREIEVLERVSRGLPSKLIARELDVSESTIKFHLSSIYAKLGVASRTEAVSRAARLGLIVL